MCVLVLKAVELASTLTLKVRSLNSSMVGFVSTDDIAADVSGVSVHL